PPRLCRPPRRPRRRRRPRLGRGSDRPPTIRHGSENRSRRRRAAPIREAGGESWSLAFLTITNSNSINSFREEITMSRYQPLADFLAGKKALEWEASFAEI